MIWTKYIIQTTTKDADIISAILMDYDINDIQIENNVQLTDEELNQMYADFALDLPEDDGSCTIDFYIEFDENGTNRAKTEEKLDRLRGELKEAEELYGISPVRFESLEVDSYDWENNWKAYFKPFTIEDILIRPTWEEVPAGYDGNVEILIDPGMAFGTGTHETTRLCVKAIRKYLKEGDAFMDLGCGSGILGIAAAKLGAGKVTEVDIDPSAVNIARENFALNGIEGGNVSFLVGDLVKNEEVKAALADNKADFICANIMAEVLAMMMGGLSDYLKEGGIIVMSGILTNKEALIREAISGNPALEYMHTEIDGDWVSVYARRV